MDSAYEKERLANIAENERLLQELGIAGGGSSVLGTVPQKRGPNDAARRQRKRAQTEEKPTRVQPKRTSARLQGAKPEDVGSGEYAVKVESEREHERSLRLARHDDLDLKQLTEDALDEEELGRLKATLDIPPVDSKPESKPSEPSELESLLNTMRLRSHSRVAQKRIYSMLYHPSTEKDLVFTGDQEGVLGVWNALDTSVRTGYEEEDMPSGSAFSLRVHAKSAIGCLRMDPANDDRLYSSSYDASVRSFSLSSGTSTEIYAAPPDVQLGEMDILAPQTQAAVATATPSPQLSERSLWLADHRGGLLHLDIRSNQPAVHRWQVCDKKIGGMSVNPMVPHCIATASNDRTMRLFDARMLKTLPETEEFLLKPSQDDLDQMETLHEKAQLGSVTRKMACTSISFSPNGRHLAGVCYDDTLSLWELEPEWLSNHSAPQSKTLNRPRESKAGRLTEWFKTARSSSSSYRPDNLLAQPHTLRHNNQTGKWVTLFRALWHSNPSLEPHFSIGGMTRHAEIFGKDGRLLASLYDPEWITAIPAVIAMHPILPARVATGNGSGRCTLWAPP